MKAARNVMVYFAIPSLVVFIILYLNSKHEDFDFLIFLIVLAPILFMLFIYVLVMAFGKKDK